MHFRNPQCKNIPFRTLQTTKGSSPSLATIRPAVTFNFGLKKWLNDKLPRNRSSTKDGRRLLTERAKNGSVRNLENICPAQSAKRPHCRKWSATKQSPRVCLGGDGTSQGYSGTEPSQCALWQIVASPGTKRGNKSRGPAVSTSKEPRGSLLFSRLAPAKTALPLRSHACLVEERTLQKEKERTHSRFYAVKGQAKGQAVNMKTGTQAAFCFPIQRSASPYATPPDSKLLPT